MNTIKTINIKGKEYITVNERLKVFRELYKSFSLTSVITHLNENGVVIRATMWTLRFRSIWRR